MRDDEKYQPKLKWELTWPDLICPHTGGVVQMYTAKIDGRHAAGIRKEFGGQQAGLWAWSGCDSVAFNRLSDGTIDRGMEKTARLAVQRAEEYFFALMASPLRPKCHVPINNEWDPDNDRPDEGRSR